MESFIVSLIKNLTAIGHDLQYDLDPQDHEGYNNFAITLLKLVDFRGLSLISML